MYSDYIPIADVSLSKEEIDAAVEVLKSGYLRQGKKTKEFEKEFAKKVGSKYALAVSSGTAALHLSYLGILEKGSDVLVSTFSHISTASMISFSGCNPVFCDIDSRKFTLDLESAKKRITKNTTAIVPVHLFGNSCDIDNIISFAKENNLRIIWDAAQAHGTKYKGKDVGSFDDVVCYSFYPTKNMLVGEGGMITTNDENLYKKLKLLRSHGQKKKYYHTRLGLNYRMTDVEAAIGIKQLERLDKLNEKRRKNAKYLTEHLSKIDGIITPYVEDGVKHVYHQYTVLLDLEKFNCSRDEFIEDLDKEGIGAAVHYPRPIHKQPIFEKIVGKSHLQKSEEISKKIFSLPVHPLLDKKDLKRIVEAVQKVASENRA